MDSQVEQAVEKLTKTSEGLDPAVRMQLDRQEAKLQKRGLIGASFLMAISNVVLAVACVVFAWLALHRDREYFGVDHNQIIPMYPLGAPYRSPADVIAFARTTAERAFTLDFNNYRSNLEDSRIRFTKAGFASYIDGLKTSGMFDTLNKRMNLTSSAGVGVLCRRERKRGHTPGWCAFR